MKAARAFGAGWELEHGYGERVHILDNLYLNAALARYKAGALSFIGEALTPDGARRWRREASISVRSDAAAEARALGETLGAEIRAEAGDALQWSDA